MPANPRPWTYRKTYVGTSPFLEIFDANGKAIAYMTLWPENVEENAKLICEAVNSHPTHGPLALLSAARWGIAGDPGPEIVSGPVSATADEPDDESRGAIAG